MIILSAQSTDILIGHNDIIYPHSSYKRLSHAWECYNRLFLDYNNMKNTNYENFFWGFSHLLIDNDVLSFSKSNLKRCSAAIGLKATLFILLDVPDDIILESDFYNFTDQIFKLEEPEAINMEWSSIYSDAISEKQVIFPFFEKEWIIDTLYIRDGEIGL